MSTIKDFILALVIGVAFISGMTAMSVFVVAIVPIIFWLFGVGQ